MTTRQPFFAILLATLAIPLHLTACAGAPAAPGAPSARVDAARLASELTLWPEESRRTIAESVARAAAGGSAPPFAVFDADGTLWSSDATESFIAYLEERGILTAAELRPEIKVVPFLPGEGVYSYYQRLCAMDKAIGYPFAAQVFAGFTLAQLRSHYEAMMKTAGSHVRVWKDGAFADEFVAVPKLFPQQAQLIRALAKSGVKVYIVTASSEELVRFLACDPACGAGFDLNLPPEQVIGVNLLLRDDKTGAATSSRLRLNRSPRLFDAQNTREQWETLRVTSFVLPPVSMYSGKVAAITTFIHPTQPPVLVAGDSGNDFPMLFHSAGARIWVKHHYTQPGLFEEAMKKYGQLPDPARGWVHGAWDVK